MSNSRILGNNIALELSKRNLSVGLFAKNIGFTETETQKLIEGRMFLPPFQLKAIAKTLSISVEDLTADRGCEAYNSLIHNFGEFNSSENQKLVLDMIDMYADLEEALYR